MMNKQQRSSFGSLVVTPCFLGVACCPSVVVTLSPVSHRAKAEGLGGQIQAQGEVKLLRNCFHTPGPDSLPCSPSHLQQHHQFLRKHWRALSACYHVTANASGQSLDGSTGRSTQSGAFGKR